MKIKNFQKVSGFNFQNFYEIGKWSGDRIGFPRVGIVNISLELISDTYKYLQRLVDNKRITVEIQCKNKNIEIKEIINKLSKRLEIPKKIIKISYNPGMYGNFVMRVYTQSRVLYRWFQKQANEVSRKSKENIAKFIAGYADAEMTVEKRNVILTFSISRKHLREAKEIRKMLEKVLSGKITIRTAGKDEIKIHIPTNSLKEFNQKIAIYMKHKQKTERLIEVLNGNYLLPQDKEFLEFIKTNPNCTSKDLTNKFNIHPDSCRKLLRLFTKQGIITRCGCGHYMSPYRYNVSRQLI